MVFWREDALLYENTYVPFPFTEPEELQTLLQFEGFIAGTPILSPRFIQWFTQPRSSLQRMIQRKPMCFQKND